MTTIRLRPFVLYWLPVLLWMTLIIGLSSQSNLPQRTDPATGERIGTTYSLAKTWHVIEFSFLSVLVYRAFSSRGGGVALSPERAATAAVLVCFAFASLDEFRQSFVPRREASLVDVLLDTTAALVAAFVCALWLRRRLGRGAARSDASSGSSS